VPENRKNPFHLRKQTTEWLRSAKAFEKRFPRFYRIPKIHKKPFALRPIVPCHSVISGPPAKLLSKMLKPALKATSTLITMSKQVTDKLLEIRIPKGKLEFIITADVVSMYTNIPFDKLGEVCT
jgi:hypothetical protein